MFWLAGGLLIFESVLLFGYGVYGMAVPNCAILLDYENGTNYLNFNGFLMCYGLALGMNGAAAVVVGGKIKTFNDRNSTTVALSILARYGFCLCTVTIITALVWLCNSAWFVQYGHVAVLDAKMRNHDVDRACWQGIMVETNSIGLARNCFNQDHVSYCAICRFEYYRDEATFLKCYRFAFVVLQIVLLCPQFVYAYTYIVTQNKWFRITTASTKTIITTASANECDNVANYNDTEYSVPKNNKPLLPSSSLLSSSRQLSSVAPPLLPPPPPPSPLSTFWRSDFAFIGDEYKEAPACTCSFKNENRQCKTYNGYDRVNNSY